MKKLILLLTLIAFGASAPLPAAEVAPAKVNARSQARHHKAKKRAKSRKAHRKAAKKRQTRNQHRQRRLKA